MKAAAQIALLLVLVAVLAHMLVQRERRAEALEIARSSALAYRISYCYQGKLFVGLREIEYDRAMARAAAVGVEYAELDRIRQGVLNEVYSCSNSSISQQVAGAGQREVGKKKALQDAALRAAAESKAIDAAERAVQEAVEASRAVHVVFQDGKCVVPQNDPSWAAWSEKHHVAQRHLNSPYLPRATTSRLRVKIYRAVMVWEEELSLCRRRAILNQ